MDFTDLYNFQTANGIVVPTDADILSGVQDKFKEIFGSDLDVSASTPVGRLIATIVKLVKSSLGITAQNANQFNLDMATGINIDALGQMYGLTRDPGSRTKIPVKAVSSIQDMTIRRGALIRSISGDLFEIDADIVADEPYGDGYWVGRGTASSSEIGPIDGTRGTVTKMASGITGWESVENDGDPIKTGTNTETDEEFRSRIRKSRGAGSCFYESILSSLYRITGVRSACILENNNLIDAVKFGVPMQSHSVFICVDHESGTEIEDSIAEAIAKSVPAGVALENGLEDEDAVLVEREIDVGAFASGGSVVHTEMLKKVFYYRPAYVNPSISLKVYPSAFTGKDLEGHVKESAIEYISSLPVGTSLSGLLLANHIMKSVQGVVVLSSKVDFKNDNDTPLPKKDIIEANGYQKFVCSEDDIEIEILNGLY